MGSSGLIHTPGFFRSMQHQYKVCRGKEKAHAVDVVNEGYFRGNDREAAEGLLKGTIPFEVEGDKQDVFCFDYNGTAFDTAKFEVWIDGSEPISDEEIRVVFEEIKRRLEGLHVGRQTSDGSIAALPLAVEVKWK